VIQITLDFMQSKVKESLARDWIPVTCLGHFRPRGSAESRRFRQAPLPDNPRLPDAHLTLARRPARREKP